MLAKFTARNRQAVVQFQQKRMFGHGHGHGEPEVFNPKDLALPAAYLFTGLVALKMYFNLAVSESREMDAQFLQARSNGELERAERVLGVYKD